MCEQRKSHEGLHVSLKLEECMHVSIKILHVSVKPLHVSVRPFHVSENPLGELSCKCKVNRKAYM